jgi:hypothetical protein
MREYQLASTVWNASIIGDLEREVANGKVVAEDLDISRCPP